MTDINFAVYEEKDRDKYGRIVRRLYPVKQWGKTKVVIVTLPRTAWERNGGLKYLVNNWQHPSYIDGISQGEAQGKIVYTKTIAQARAVAHQMIGQGL